MHSSVRVGAALLFGGLAFGSVSCADSGQPAVDASTTPHHGVKVEDVTNVDQANNKSDRLIRIVGDPITYTCPYYEVTTCQSVEQNEIVDFRSDKRNVVTALFPTNTRKGF